jgi:hypothetical protein
MLTAVFLRRKVTQPSSRPSAFDDLVLAPVKTANNFIAPSRLWRGRANELENPALASSDDHSAGPPHDVATH